MNRKASRTEGERPRLLADFQDAGHAREVARCNTEKQDHGLEKALDNRLIELCANRARSMARRFRSNCRSGTATAPSARCSRMRFARRYGHEGLPDGTIHARFAGSAGQSFGAFPRQRRDPRSDRRHQRLLREGTLGAGRIIVSPSPKFRGEPTEKHHHGATSFSTARSPGSVFPRRGGASVSRCATRAPPPFVEGVGDHGLRIHDRRYCRRPGRHRDATSPPECPGGIAYVLDSPRRNS